MPSVDKGRRSARGATDGGPALARPHHARSETGEEVPLKMVAMPLKLLDIQVMPVVAQMQAARRTAMAAAGRRLTGGRQCNGCERK